MDQVGRMRFINRLPMWGGWRVIRVSPLGERMSAIVLPCANVTKAVFAGGDSKTLYITTARKGLTESQLAEQPLAGGLFAVDVDVVGLPPGQFFARVSKR